LTCNLIVARGNVVRLKSFNVAVLQPSDKENQRVIQKIKVEMS